MFKFSRQRIGYTLIKILSLGIMLSPQYALATVNPAPENAPLDFFSEVYGWTQIADNDGTTSPGYGGQDFDAEYLFYKYDELTRRVSIGLQTGFNLKDGKIDAGTGDPVDKYYAGDLALSFDGSTVGPQPLNGYEYAVDFGLETKDYYGEDGVGLGNDKKDDAGLYEVTKWNDEILHGASSPFGMDDGVLLQEFNGDDQHGDDQNFKGYDNLDASEIAAKSVEINARLNSYGSNDVDDKSYFRIVTFDLDSVVGLSESFTVDAHWTMSCGNDEINGSFNIGNVPVPEPTILPLMLIGGLGFGLVRFRKRRNTVDYS